MFKGGKHRFEIAMITRTETADPETVRTKEIYHSHDKMIRKERDALKPKKLKKQDMITAKGATGPVPKITTNSPNQGKLLIP